MKRSSLRASAFVDRVRKCLKIATAAMESCRSGVKSELMAGISRLTAVHRSVSSQVSTSRAVSVFLSIAAALATLSVCSAQSIEIAELTDDALQIDWTVMYINGANLGGAKGVVDRVTVEEYLLNSDLIWVRIQDVNNNTDSSHAYGGNDTLRGGNHNDTLYGDFGVDTLFGDGGNDSLFGGSGTIDLSVDTLWGNLGADRFKPAFKPGVNPPVQEDTFSDFNALQGDKTFE